ncbi:MAG: DNA-deoxyinosine glycosylase [Clostridia bacterium]|nr:DNA-deoxyinosine glycosylase [Clostridia bacterium]
MNTKNTDTLPLIGHGIPPVYNGQSHTLILGSFPSVKSRETAFYYGHPQNRFWRVMAAVLNAPCPATTQEKTDMLLNNGIALWDVIGACRILGSRDETITDAVPNDLGRLFAQAPITRVFTNGARAHALYAKWFPLAPADTKLPSTSPANAAWPLDRLVQAWAQLRPE